MGSATGRNPESPCRSLLGLPPEAPSLPRFDFISAIRTPAPRPRSGKWLEQCSSGRKTTLKNLSQIVLVLCQHPPVAPRPTWRTSHSLHTVQRTQSVRAGRHPTSLPLTHSLQPRQLPCAARMFQPHSHLGLTAPAALPASESPPAACLITLGSSSP